MLTKTQTKAVSTSINVLKQQRDKLERMYTELKKKEDKLEEKWDSLSEEIVMCTCKECGHTHRKTAEENAELSRAEEALMDAEFDRETIELALDDINDCIYQLLEAEA